MIASFKSKALWRLYEGGSGKGLPPAFVPKIRRSLFALEQAERPEDLSQPGFGLHELTGNRRGIWSIVITPNWRLTFRFDGGNVIEADFEDYH